MIQRRVEPCTSDKRPLNTTGTRWSVMAWEWASVEQLDLVQAWTTLSSASRNRTTHPPSTRTSGQIHQRGFNPTQPETNQLGSPPYQSNQLDRRCQQQEPQGRMQVQNQIEGTTRSLGQCQRKRRRSPQPSLSTTIQRVTGLVLTTSLSKVSRRMYLIKTPTSHSTISQVLMRPRNSLRKLYSYQS